MPTPDQIIEGYLKTEIEYINTIKYVFANVYTPLHAAMGTRSELLPAADLDSIFAQLSSIMEIASDFLASLRRCPPRTPSLSPSHLILLRTSGTVTAVLRLSATSSAAAAPTCSSRSTAATCAITPTRCAAFAPCASARPSFQSL